MFTTKTLEKTQHDCNAGRTKRKADYGLVGIRGEAPVLKEIDPFTLIQELADRISAMETTLICLCDKSLQSPPPPPPQPNPLPVEFLDHLKGGLEVKIVGGLQAINSHFQASQLNYTIKSLVDKIQQLPQQPSALVQPITVNAPEPNIQNLIEIRVPDAIPPVINNYIPDSHPIINNYLPESSALNEILRTLTSLEQTRANRPKKMNMCSTVQYLYLPPKKISYTESYCQAQARTKESYSQTYSLQDIKQKKAFRITFKPVIRNYVATPAPNVLVRPAAPKLHIYPRFSIKQIQPKDPPQKTNQLKRKIKYVEKTKAKTQYRPKKIKYIQKIIANSDDQLKVSTKQEPKQTSTKQEKDKTIRKIEKELHLGAEGTQVGKDEIKQMVVHIAKLINDNTISNQESQQLIETLKHLNQEKKAMHSSGPCPKSYQDWEALLNCYQSQAPSSEEEEEILY